MKATISERELLAWQVYYSIEPWGPERADLNAGIIASTVANVHRDSKHRPEPFTAADFMPRYDRDPELEKPEDSGMAPETVLAVMERLAAHQEKVERQTARKR